MCRVWFIRGFYYDKEKESSNNLNKGRESLPNLHALCVHGHAPPPQRATLLEKSRI